MRRIAITVALCATLCLAAVALAERPPSINAPKKARVGVDFRVRARNLQPDRYSLTFYSNRSPDRDSTCAVRLDRSTAKTSKPSFDARIPARIGCYSGFPASQTGKIRTTPGRYRLEVGVQQSTISPAPGSDRVGTRIRVTAP